MTARGSGPSPQSTPPTSVGAAASGGQERPLPAALAAKYRVGALISAGGFGAVYRAIHADLGRPVALKLLHAEGFSDPQHVERFVNEAQVTASLRHPHIIVILDHGVEDSVPWIAYELLPGPTLRAVIEGGPTAPRDALPLARQVASALQEAHSHGILHRDIKPENVIRALEGVYKVTDFGLAKWMRDARIRTQTGVILGTPDYIAPELVSGEPPSASSDIYAVGVLLYELITGCLPFQGASLQELLVQRLRTDPPPPRTLVEGLQASVDTLVMRLLSRVPCARPQSARDLVADIDEVLTSSLWDRRASGANRKTRVHRASSAAPAGATRVARSSRRSFTSRLLEAAARRPIVAGAVLAGVAVGLTAGVLAVAGGGRRPPPSRSLQVPVVAASARAGREGRDVEAPGRSAPIEVVTRTRLEAAVELAIGALARRDSRAADLVGLGVKWEISGAAWAGRARALAISDRKDHAALDAAARFLAGKYSILTRAPDPELALWRRTLAHRYASWSRICRFEQAAVIYEKKTELGAMDPGRYGDMEHLTYGREAAAHLEAFFNSVREVLIRASQDPGAWASTMGPLLDDLRTVGERLMWLKADEPIHVRLVKGFESSLKGLGGPLGNTLRQAATGVLRWGVKGSLGLEHREALRDTIEILKVLVGAVPEAAGSVRPVIEQAQRDVAPHTARPTPGGAQPSPGPRAGPGDPDPRPGRGVPGRATR